MSSSISFLFILMNSTASTRCDWFIDNMLLILRSKDENFVLVILCFSESCFHPTRPFIFVRIPLRIAIYPTKYLNQATSKLDDKTEPPLM